jgi:UDP-N-acetylglucosamine 2-epimerase (non-hydrolysing)
MSVGQNRKIILVIGTRPEAIKMFPVVNALRQTDGIDVKVCVTAQHRALLDQVLKIAEIRPDFDLDVMRQDQSLDELASRLLIALGGLLDRERPDRVIVHGDTLTTMAAALAAYFRRIPVGHVEAGLRSGDIYQPWPEEVNRRVVGTIADMHFAPTSAAAEALVKENVPPQRIHVTGNTVIDALIATTRRIEENPDLAQYLDPYVTRFANKRIIAVTTHRRENFGEGMLNIAAAIAEIAQRDDVAIIFPVHPNPNVKPLMEEILLHIPNVAMLEPLDYPNFVRLLSVCTLVLSDSGGVQEEAPSLGKPVLVMRDTTERPEGIGAGTARLVGSDRTRIVATVNSLLDNVDEYDRMSSAHNPYGDGNAAIRIAEILREEARGRRG